MSDVSVPTTPTNPDLREQIPSAIADPGAFVPRAKERGAGGQYESVPQWAARAVGSLVWPLVAEARAEADMHRRTRLRVERVLDEALGAEEKDGTGEGLAADVRLAITRRDEEIERLRVELEQAEDESAQLRRQVIDERVQATQTSQELFAKWRGERDSERESRIAWALEADRLQQIALQAVAKLEKLRDEQLDRIAPVECDCAEHGVDCHAAGAQFAYMRAIRIVRPSVSDQTPATPDEPALLVVPDAFVCDGAKHVDGQVPCPHCEPLQRWTWDGKPAYQYQQPQIGSFSHNAAPSSDVPGLNPDCTADEAACVHGQTADLTGLAAREAQS